MLCWFRGLFYLRQVDKGTDFRTGLLLGLKYSLSILSHPPIHMKTHLWISQQTMSVFFSDRFYKIRLCGRPKLLFSDKFCRRKPNESLWISASWFSVDWATCAGLAVCRQERGRVNESPAVLSCLHKVLNANADLYFKPGSSANKISCWVRVCVLFGSGTHTVFENETAIVLWRSPT